MHVPTSPEDDLVPPLPGWIKATFYIRIVLQWFGSFAVVFLLMQDVFPALSPAVNKVISLVASFAITGLLLMLWQVNLRHQALQSLRDASWEVVMQERRYIDSHIDYIRTWDAERLGEFRNDLCDENIQYFEDKTDVDAR